MLHWTAFLLVLPIVGELRPAAAPPGVGDEGAAVFERVVRPVLEGTCARCHGALKASGGLRLDTRRSLLEGGDSGPAVVPGDPGSSLVIQAIRHEDGLAMPPKRPKLPAETIAAFVKWVELGAPDPRTGRSTTPATSWPAEVRQHWAFRPVRKTAPPIVKHREWVRNPVDVFILATLEGAQLAARAGDWPGRVAPPRLVRPDRPAAVSS